MARIWVLDCETTGTDFENDKVVEVGGVLLDGNEVVMTYESLVNPGIPIPPRASAVHHLTDKHVHIAPGLDAALQPILEEDFDYVVAHNSKFDSKFLDLGDVPWICTYKCAHAVYQDAPGYGLQVLRYWRGLPDPTSGSNAHRALYDAECAAFLLIDILEQAQTPDPYPGMIKVTNNPIIFKGKVGFGEHAERLWSEVPSGYLKWMVSKTGWDEDRLATAQYWLARK